MSLNKVALALNSNPLLPLIGFGVGYLAIKLIRNESKLLSRKFELEKAIRG